MASSGVYGSEQHPGIPVRPEMPSLVAGSTYKFCVVGSVLLK